MTRKSTLLLCFSLIFVISCGYYGVFLNVYAEINENMMSDTINIEEEIPLDNHENADDDEPKNEEKEGNNIDQAASNSEDYINPLIDQLIDKIQASNEDCWRKPASNRKITTVNKLTELKDLISSNNLEDAYDKLLHDIKPKLTGLKTDENEEPWGNGEFKNPWVICTDLQEEFRLDCNDILYYIKNPAGPK